MKVFLLFLLLTAHLSADYYFPPIESDDWETISVEQLGWDIGAKEDLIDSLKKWNSKAFIVLKDGKIVIEEYMNDFKQDSLWYWASAGKSLTAFLIGLAQEQNHLNINAPTSSYIGTGWTSLAQEKEDLITVRHQLTMTTGLDYNGDLDCTDPECLSYLSNAGSIWYYHNAPYTLLHPVLESATGQKINIFLYNNISKTTGIDGAFFKTGYNSVFFSKARAMARFGSLMLNRGMWAQTQVMEDLDYYHAMINSSQDLNKSYGYLWWLNGKSECMIPGSDQVFNSNIFQGVPSDAYAALGKNGQILLIVPSMDLVLIRMGESNDKALVSITLVNDIWRQMAKIIGHSDYYLDQSQKPHIYLYNTHIILDNINHYSNLEIYNTLGQLLFEDSSGNAKSIDIKFEDRVFFVKLRSGIETFWYKFIRND